MLRVILQPYYFWDGHYKQYSHSLSSKNSIVIICNKKKIKYCLNLYPLFINYNANSFFYAGSRIFNSLKVIIYLIFNIYLKKRVLIHFLEFEPVSKLFLLFLNIFFRQRIIFTIHATRLIKINSILDFILFFIQRLFFIFSIFLSNFSPCRFVVHNKENKIFLQKLVFKKRIFLLDYPCDNVSNKKKTFNLKKKKKF